MTKKIKPFLFGAELDKSKIQIGCFTNETQKKRYRNILI